MDKLNVVFITGAGFSAASGGPLISDFLDKARRIYRISDDNSYLEKTKNDFYKVYEAIGNLGDMYAKTYLDTDNIESLFGAIEFGLMINKFGKLKGDEIVELRDSLIRVIVTTIETLIKFQRSTPAVIYKPLDEYVKFFDEIKQRQKKCNFSFITFNYDLIQDVGLEHADLDYTYAFEDHQATAIPLLKLHGSLNWYQQNDKMYIFKDRTHENDAINLAELKDKQESLYIGSQIISNGVLPYIIPPTLNKFKYQESLKSIWSRAASVLSEAEIIIIIGYSMPETDVFFKYLYSLGVASPKYLHKLLVINSASMSRGKYQTMVNMQKDEKKFDFRSELFPNNQNHIFREIDNLI